MQTVSERTVTSAYRDINLSQKQYYPYSGKVVQTPSKLRSSISCPINLHQSPRLVYHRELNQTVDTSISSTQSQSDFQSIEDRLSQLYTFKNNNAVMELLLQNIFLIDALETLRSKIDVFFGIHVNSVSLERFDDHEEDFSNILIRIDSDLSVSDTLASIDRFDFEYWLDMPADIRRAITVTV